MYVFYDDLIIFHNLMQYGNQQYAEKEKKQGVSLYGALFVKTV